MEKPMDQKTLNKWLEKYTAFLQQENIIYGIQKILPSLIFNYNPSLRLTFDKSGESYTNGKRMNLSMSYKFFKDEYTHAHWTLVMRALAAHESQHINSTTMTAKEEVGKWFGEYLNTHFSINKNIGENVGADFFNIFEDGRIEQIAVIHHPGVRMPLLFMNVEGVKRATLPSKFSTSYEEYISFRNQVLCYAKLGKNLQGFRAMKDANPRFRDNFISIQDHIDLAVNSVNCDGCVAQTEAALEKLAPYFAELLEEDSKLLDHLEKMDTKSSYGEEESEFGDETGSGSSVRDNKNYGKARWTISKEKKGDKGEDSENKDSSESGDSPKEKENGKDDKDGKASETGDKEDGQEDGSSGAATGDKDEASEEGSGGDGDKPGDKNGSDGSGSSSDLSSKKSEDGDAKPTESSKVDKKSGSGKCMDGDPVFDAPKYTDPGEDEDFDPMELPYSEQELIDELESCSSSVSPASKENPEEKNALSKKDKDKLLEKYEDEYSRSFDETYSENPPASLPSDIMMKASKLHRTLTQILQQRRKEMRGQRKGVFDTRSLWKVGVNSPDIFYRKGRPQEADCAVFELVDNSGSMSGVKSKIARTVAGALEVALEGLAALKISLFNVGYSFSAGGGGVLHNTIKDFSDRTSKGKSYAFGSLVDSTISAGGGNKDGYSIRVATAELLKRKEKNKFLIVVSDGEPTDYNGGVPAGVEDVKKAVAEARKAGIIVIAFLIGDRSYVTNHNQRHIEMYGKNLICCETENMLYEFEKLFKKLIKNT